MQEAEEYIESKFVKLEDKNSFANLYNFCDRYDYRDNYVKVCTKLVKKYIFENIKCFSREIKEISNFINLMNFLIKKEKLTAEEFAKITFEYMKLEVRENEHINTTCRINN